MKWATEGRDGNHASILVAPEHVLFLTDAGTLIVTPRGSDKFVEERRYEIGTSATWAIPVLFPNGLLVREATGLVRLDWLGKLLVLEAGEPLSDIPWRRSSRISELISKLEIPRDVRSF